MGGGKQATPGSGGGGKGSNNKSGGAAVAEAIKAVAVASVSDLTVRCPTCGAKDRPSLTARTLRDARENEQAQCDETRGKLTSTNNSKKSKQRDHGPSIQVVLRHLAETQGKPRDSLGGGTGQLRQLLLRQLEQVRLRTTGK